MPTENGDNCQYASCSSRKLAFLIGEGLKYIIVFTDIIFYFVSNRSTNFKPIGWVIGQR
jgi:hypothetical protein